MKPAVAAGSVDSAEIMPNHAVHNMFAGGILCVRPARPGAKMPPGALTASASTADAQAGRLKVQPRCDEV